MGICYKKNVFSVFSMMFLILLKERFMSSIWIEGVKFMVIICLEWMFEKLCVFCLEIWYLSVKVFIDVVKELV